MLLAVIVSIAVCFKQHISFEKFKEELLSWNVMTITFLILCVHIIYCLLYCQILRRKRSTIIRNGTQLRGKIIGVNTVENRMKQSGSISNYYIYTMKLSDGRTISTNLFYEDFNTELRLHECNVYEYNGKFAFADFE